MEIPKQLLSGLLAEIRMGGYAAILGSNYIIAYGIDKDGKFILGDFIYFKQIGKKLRYVNTSSLREQNPRLRDYLFSEVTSLINEIISVINPTPDFYDLTENNPQMAKEFEAELSRRVINALETLGEQE